MFGTLYSAYLSDVDKQPHKHNITLDEESLFW